MSDVFERLPGGGVVADYTQLTPGSPVGDRHVIVCTKCGKPAVARGKSALHVVRYVQSATGKVVLDKVRWCSGGVPVETRPKPAQTGFSWCPKEWL